MQNIPLWNQSRLICPSTSAHKVDLSVSTQFHGIMSSFITNSSEKTEKLKGFLMLMTSEVVILKRFLYKVAAVFSHDKTYKMLNQIHNSANRLLETDLVSDLTSFLEQHNLFANVMFVAPKPKYEYVQVRLQGTVKLLAHILCLCQCYGSLMIQKMRIGHFMNIVVISMSFAARIWALSLHMMYFLMELYDVISKNVKTEGLIPTTTVSFLPKDYVLPLSLEHWLKSDEILNDMHPLLMRKQEIENTISKTEIWQSIRIDDDERQQLLQLKEIVTSTKIREKSTESLLSFEVSSLDKFQPNISADIGELVLRKTVAPVSKSKRKRAKKCRLN